MEVSSNKRGIYYAEGKISSLNSVERPDLLVLVNCKFFIDLTKSNFID